MEKDTQKTDVMFRYELTKDFKGEIFALFPHNVEMPSGAIMSYQHVGQHSPADYYHCIKTSRPATIEEYKDLKDELESIGYNLNIIRRRNMDKYLESYRSQTFFTEIV